MSIILKQCSKSILGAWPSFSIMAQLLLHISVISSTEYSSLLALLKTRHWDSYSIVGFQFAVAARSGS